MTTDSEFWSHHYYKLAKKVTHFVGQWPYQSRGDQIARGVVMWIILLLHDASQVLLYY